MGERETIDPAILETATTQVVDLYQQREALYSFDDTDRWDEAWKKLAQPYRIEHRALAEHIERLGITLHFGYTAQKENADVVSAYTSSARIFLDSPDTVELLYTIALGMTMANAFRRLENVISFEGFRGALLQLYFEIDSGNVPTAEQVNGFNKSLTVPDIIRLAMEGHMELAPTEEGLEVILASSPIHQSEAVDELLASIELPTQYWNLVHRLLFARGQHPWYSDDERYGAELVAVLANYSESHGLSQSDKETIIMIVLRVVDSWKSHMARLQ